MRNTCGPCSGAVALLPAVVVQDELRAGSLQQYCTVPRVHENSYAITTARQFQPAPLREPARGLTPQRAARG